MGLKAVWGGFDSSDKSELKVPNVERYLSMLVEGTSRNVPEIDSESYREFRANVSRLSLQIPDHLPDADKVALIRTIVHEFENYRAGSDNALRAQVGMWRVLVERLFLELVASMGMGSASAGVAPLKERIEELSEAGDIENFTHELRDFLHPKKEAAAVVASPFRVADHSTANDNAAGLMGGGSAVDRLRAVLARGGTGFIAVFRLSCLEIISQRFGPEAVEDCLMAVSAFLTASLHNDDAIYHWSDASLLAILQGRANELILTAELQRIAAANRETNVTIGGRNIMLRIPITFDLTPINQLTSAEDLYKIAALRNSKW
jgi:GGDEF domain-containing protein